MKNVPFWVYFICSLILGFILGDRVDPFEFSIQYLLMVVLFFVFLRVDLKEVVSQLSRPLLFVSVLILNLLVLPVLVFFSLSFLPTEVLAGFVLFAAVPTGVAATAVSDLLGAKSSLTLVVAVSSSLISIFTIPFLFDTLFGSSLRVDSFGLFVSLLKLVCIPLVVSEIFKRVASKKLLSFGKKHGNSFVIFFTCMLIVVVFGSQAHSISYGWEQLGYLALLLLLNVIFLLIGYYVSFRLPKKERLAVACSKVFMNLSLALALASLFFDTGVLVVLILSQITWSLMIGVFEFSKKWLP